MFIPRLFLQSKITAIFFSLLIALFVFINYKWGVVATPIYQLGMYSGVAHTTDTQTIYTLYVDNKPISLHKLPFPHADMILVSISRYDNQMIHNKEVMEVFNKYSNRLFNQPLPMLTYTNSLSDKQAGLWFNQLLRKYGIPFSKLSVYLNKYIWEKNHLKPLGQEKLIHDFAADL